MKKTVCCLLAVSFLAVLAACGNTKGDVPSENTKTTGAAESSTVTETGVFNLETKTVLLNSGYEMPVYGIGTYSLTGETCVESVSSALESGVRLIDTAYMYHKE